MAVIGTTLMTLGFLALLGMLRLEEKVTWLLYAILPLPTIGFSCLNPSLQSLLSRHTAEDQQGRALGVGQSMSALARIAGPVCGFTLHKQGESLPYLAAAILMAIGIGMVGFLKPPPATAQ
jgi:MFS family permease